jgi:hypothetical protein
VTASIGLVFAGVLAGVAPTVQDIDWARTASMPGNFTHCVRLKNLRCKPAGEAAQYDCTYREYRNSGSWPKKSITVDSASGSWVKIAGDAPMCSVMNLDLPSKN